MLKNRLVEFTEAAAARGWEIKNGEFWVHCTQQTLNDPEIEAYLNGSPDINLSWLLDRIAQDAYLMSYARNIPRAHRRILERQQRRMEGRERRMRFCDHCIQEMLVSESELGF